MIGSLFTVRLERLPYWAQALVPILQLGIEGPLFWKVLCV